MVNEVISGPVTLAQWGPIVMAGAFFLFLGLETVFPLRRQTRPRWRRIWVNALMTALVFAAGALAVRRAASGASTWALATHFGLLNLVPLPGWLQFVLGFLWLDYTFYVWHRINHRYGILWRFHNVHHCDPDMDVTTSFRFHAVEVLYSTFFRVVQVLVLGVGWATYVIYEVFFQLLTMFHHSNLKLPLGLERLLNRVVVTPRMHGVHHSWVSRETYSNFGVVFRWWDRLHGSLRVNIPQDRITIGVPGYAAPEDNNLWSLLAMPFRPQRPYWLGPDGRRTLRADQEEGPDRHSLVA